MESCPPAPYPTLKPETNLDSSSAETNRVQLVSANNKQITQYTRRLNVNKAGNDKKNQPNYNGKKNSMV
jgi:hypothetical protein